MKCLVCPTEIDEVKEFPPVVIGGKEVPDAVASAKHAAELATWEHVTVTVSRGGGQATVLNGHTCPEHALVEGSVGLTKGGK